MATERIKLDGRGNNIITLFENNMSELGALNQLAASTKDVGVYHGPDEDVNINYPRDGTSYSKIGRVPGMYESYHVREIKLNQRIMTSDYTDDPMVGNPGMVTQEQHDGKSQHVAEETSTSSFHGKSNTTLLHEYGAYSNATGRADPSKFMELKGRKSLFTLLQETRAAFFDNKDRPVFRSPTPGWWRSPQNQSNKYGDHYQSYDFQYMATQGPSFVDPPSGIDFTWQALVGFNLGQALGGNVTIEDRIKTEAQNITRAIFDDLAGAAGADNNEFIANYYNRISQTIAPVDRISQLYVPGWGRPAENWRTKKPLSENLNQNILLPPNSGEIGGMNPTDVPGNKNGNGEGPPGHGSTEKTFQSLYTRNRAGKAGGVNVSNALFNNGIIAGTPVNLLQEPLGITTKQIEGDPSTPIPKSLNVPFTFEEDDANYLTYAKKETGFTSNGDRTTVDPSRMQVAVRDYSAMAGEQVVNMGRETVRFTQGQYFPFAFSTVNKRRGAERRLQICYLQALINSLSESYTPTWNSRHFFGRSEQAHTYTFTDRTIDIGFTIFANEMRQLQNVYERVVWLAQQCYHEYEVGNGRMSDGPVIAMRVGDLFQYKAGIIRSLSYDWLFNGGKWEMTSGMRMPQGVSVTMSYQVIHDTMPNRASDLYGGPAGGLHSASTRSREISNPAEGNAFDAFEETQGSSIGFGTPLIDTGDLVPGYGEASFMEELAGASAAYGLDPQGDFRSEGDGDLEVPVADPKGELIYV